LIICWHNDKGKKYFDGKVQKFKGSKVQKFKGSKVQRFKGSKVQNGSMLFDSLTIGCPWLVVV